MESYREPEETGADDSEEEKSDNPYTPTPPLPLRKSPSSRKGLSGQKKIQVIKKIKAKVQGIEEQTALTILKEILQKAAINMLAFPAQLDSEEQVKSLQSAYKKQKVAVREKLIRVFPDIIDDEFTNKFLSFIGEDDSIMIEDWDPDFLSFIKDGLRISIPVEPIVQAGIRYGKIYWRIVKGEGGREIYKRPHKNKEDGFEFDFKESNTWHMDWNTFRKFKDSGKRSGTLAITKDKFIEEIKKIDGEKSTYKKASAIWDELSKNGVLNSRNRLSHGWRALSDHVLKLEILKNRSKQFPKTSKVYTVVTQAIYNIAHASSEKEVINLKEVTEKKFSIYRPERSLKSWGKTGRVENKDLKTPSTNTRLWDVSIHNDIAKHLDNTVEPKKILCQSGDTFQCDHIPSSAMLKELAKSEEETAEEKKEGWWAIAVPQTLHNENPTTNKRLENQKASLVSHPFIEVARRYFDAIEERYHKFFNPEKNKDDIYMEALGAFRYLYRCQSKIPKSVYRENGKTICFQANATSHKHFFNNHDHLKEIDNFFLQRIRKFLYPEESFQHLAISPSSPSSGSSLLPVTPHTTHSSVFRRLSTERFSKESKFVATGTASAIFSSTSRSGEEEELESISSYSQEIGSSTLSSPSTGGVPSRRFGSFSEYSPFSPLKDTTRSLAASLSKNQNLSSSSLTLLNKSNIITSEESYSVEGQREKSTAKATKNTKR